jgi:hypothetical protein
MVGQALTNLPSLPTPLPALPGLPYTPDLPYPPDLPCLPI